MSVLKPKFGICAKLLLSSDPATYSNNNSYSTFTWCSGSSLLISYHTSTLCYMYNDVVLTACVTLTLAHNILHSTSYIASFPGRLPLHSLDCIRDLWTTRRSRRRPSIASTSSNCKVDSIMMYVDSVLVIMAMCPRVK